MHKREGEKVSNRILYMMTFEGRGDDSGTNRIVLGVGPSDLGRQSNILSAFPDR